MYQCITSSNNNTRQNILFHATLFICSYIWTDNTKILNYFIPIKNKYVNNLTNILLNCITNLRFGHTILLAVTFLAAKNDISLAASGEMQSTKHGVVINNSMHVQAGNLQHVNHLVGSKRHPQMNNNLCIESFSRTFSSITTPLVWFDTPVFICFNRLLYTFFINRSKVIKGLLLRASIERSYIHWSSLTRFVSFKNQKGLFPLSKILPCLVDRLGGALLSTWGFSFLNTRVLLRA